MQIKEQQRLLIQRRKEGIVAPTLESPGLGPPPSAHPLPPLLSASTQGSVGERRGDAVKEKVKSLRVNVIREEPATAAERGLSMKSAPARPVNGLYPSVETAAPTLSFRAAPISDDRSSIDGPPPLTNASRITTAARHASDESIQSSDRRESFRMGESRRAINGEHVRYDHPPGRPEPGRVPMTAYPAYTPRERYEYHRGGAAGGPPSRQVSGQHGFVTQTSSSRSTQPANGTVGGGGGGGDRTSGAEDDYDELGGDVDMMEHDREEATTRTLAVPAPIAPLSSSSAAAAPRSGHRRQASFTTRPPTQHVYSSVAPGAPYAASSSARNLPASSSSRQPSHVLASSTGARFPPEAFTVTPQPGNGGGGTGGGPHQTIYRPVPASARPAVPTQHASSSSLLISPSGAQRTSREAFLSPFNLFFDALLDANQLRSELGSRIRKANELVRAQEIELDRIQRLRGDYEEYLAEMMETRAETARRQQQRQ